MDGEQRMTPERACSVTYACAWLHNRACPADADIADIDIPQPDNTPISEEMVVNPTEKARVIAGKAACATYIERLFYRKYEQTLKIK